MSLDDLDTLTDCCLVNREINQAASMTLYRKLDLNLDKYTYLYGHHKHGERLQTVNERALGSASLPKHRRLVRTGVFDINLPVCRQFPEDSKVFERPISFKNLNEALRTLQDPNRHTGIREFKLANQLCRHPETVNSLLQMDLCKLNLIGVNVALLEKVEKVQPRWTELHFHVKSGVDLLRLPESLRRALKPLQTVRALTVGVLLNLSDQHLFKVLSQLPHLEGLCLEYAAAKGPVHIYSFIIILSANYTSKQRRELSTTFTPLRTLKSFNLRYQDRESHHRIKTNIAEVCK
ncbi:hypothetical protein WG66_001309 [Moniliophthora roreri]|nr:hypothetical protein WG66_001309 [Moniliophthora roreri]